MKEKPKPRILTQEEAAELVKDAKPLLPPKMKKRVERSCDTCEDYIVCWGYDDITAPEKGKNCNDWHLSFAIYQDMAEDG